MPYISSTLTCQVDGLEKVYTYNKNAYFAFETQEQLNKAKEKVLQLLDSNHCPIFRQKIPEEQIIFFGSSCFSPKEARFSFGISVKSEKEPTEELIKLVANIIHSGRSSKTVPIQKMSPYKSIFEVF